MDDTVTRCVVAVDRTRRLDVQATGVGIPECPETALLVLCGCADEYAWEGPVVHRNHLKLSNPNLRQYSNTK
jgi:hypothetical protein